MKSLKKTNFDTYFAICHQPIADMKNLRSGQKSPWSVCILGQISEKLLKLYFWPFWNGGHPIHIILMRRNLKICEHLSFFNY